MSEDKDQLDWVLKQSDVIIIDKTLLNMKDPKIISMLFSQILVKLQES